MKISNPFDFDYCILGAGIAAASVAWHLAERGAGAIALLEREDQAGYHSSGRSAALYEPHYGSVATQALTRASLGFFQQPPAALFGANAPTPLLSPRGVLQIATAEQLPQLRRAFEAARAHSSSARWVEGDTLHAQYPFLKQHIAAAFYDSAAHDIDTHALLHGFLSAARQRGAQLHCRADVVGLSFEENSSQNKALWRIDLADGRRFYARHVINAAGAWADALAELAGARALGLRPLRRSALTFDVPQVDDFAQTFRHWPAVLDVDEQFYFKPDAGQLMASPADAHESAPTDARPEDIDIATAIWRINEATRLAITRPRHTWAGLRTFAPDGELCVGPDAHAPQFWWVAALGGYGMQTAPAVGALAASLILGQPLSEPLRAQGIAARTFDPGRFGRTTSA